VLLPVDAGVTQPTGRSRHRAVETDDMTFTTTDLTPRVGAEIRSDIPTLLSGKYAKEIRAILEGRAVVVLPKINMTDEEQLAFSRTLGALSDSDGFGEIFKVSLDPTETDRAYSLKASFFWHLDGTTDRVPIFASILNAKRIALVGGQTEICNTYAAYDDLSDEDKAAFETLVVHHSSVASQRHIDPQMSYEHHQLLRQRGADLPLVWKHRNGRRSLLVGSTAEFVHGLPPKESLDLLTRLRDWATKPQFVYHHEWSVGDIVMWDNTGSLHRALPYDPTSGRLMHRTQLAGVEPFAGG
jgi:alpha-ketoglutarate-dependent taurine dioxygenase